MTKVWKKRTPPLDGLRRNRESEPEYGWIGGRPPPRLMTWGGPGRWRSTTPAGWVVRGVVVLAVIAALLG